MKAPVTGEDGWPRELRGVAADVPGLYFCGLSFQYAFASMTLPGVGRDAAYVATASRPGPAWTEAVPPPERSVHAAERGI